MLYWLDKQFNSFNLSQINSTITQREVITLINEMEVLEMEDELQIYQGQLSNNFHSIISSYETEHYQNIPIFLWRNSQKKKYLTLSTIAQFVFFCRPSNASNEKDFSYAGLFDDAFRSNMHSDQFINLVLLRSYQRPPMKSFLEFKENFQEHIKYLLK